MGKPCEQLSIQISFLSRKAYRWLAKNKRLK